jgi:hypothetical protein
VTVSFPAPVSITSAPVPVPSAASPKTASRPRPVRITSSPAPPTTRTGRPRPVASSRSFPAPSSTLTRLIRGVRAAARTTWRTTPRADCVSTRTPVPAGRTSPGPDLAALSESGPYQLKESLMTTGFRPPSWAATSAAFGSDFE